MQLTLEVVPETWLKHVEKSNSRRKEFLQDFLSASILDNGNRFEWLPYWQR